MRQPTVPIEYHKVSTFKLYNCSTSFPVDTGHVPFADSCDVVQWKLTFRRDTVITAPKISMEDKGKTSAPLQNRHVVESAEDCGHRWGDNSVMRRFSAKDYPAIEINKELMIEVKLTLRPV
jgi:hypothetical protein